MSDTRSKQQKSKRNTRNKPKSQQKTRKKWSNKYKTTIDCKNPKGFSQKQYCKYGRRK